MGESEKQLENDEERNMATIKDIAAVSYTHLTLPTN